MSRFLAFALALSFAVPAHAAEDPAVAKKLAGLDAFMNKVVQDFNVPGIGIGIVVKDKLVFAKGYGYRDYGKKLPFTPKTVVPIASNTKLFTATAAGLLVEDGNLEWDKPVRDKIPMIRFYNDELNATITLRDMLSHRTGITRHDSIWYKSAYTRQQLFERLKYLEPQQPMRQTFLYNNMMYAGAGYVEELASGKTWEALVQERILTPLGMTSTGFSVDDLLKQPEPGVPYTERRDSSEIYSIPYYHEDHGLGPAGSMVSNLEDLSAWVRAQLNGGKLDGKQVLPASVIRETLSPTIAMPNAQLQSRGWGELLNAAYGTGRWTASYRGHLVAYHGGDINGFHSQISVMPQDGIGVIVLVIGDHAAPLYNPLTWNLYERMLGLPETPWMQRTLEIRTKGKAAGKESRARAGGGRVADTKPSHPLADFEGEYENTAYGVLKILGKDGGLAFDFHTITMPLSHFHYDRFDSPDDEQEGKWSFTFQTNPQGEIDKAVISMDEAPVTFTRRVPAELTSLDTLRPYAGTYLTPTGGRFDIVLREDGTLGIVFPGQPFSRLLPWKARHFRSKDFPDVTYEFVVVDGTVSELKSVDPSGEDRFPRQKQEPR